MQGLITDLQLGIKDLKYGIEELNKIKRYEKEKVYTNQNKSL